jgi:hypothetical protein
MRVDAQGTTGTAWAKAGFDMGMDVGSPIDSTYALPFAFTGKIDPVTTELGAAAAAKA